MVPLMVSSVAAVVPFVYRYASKAQPAKPIAVPMSNPLAVNAFMVWFKEECATRLRPELRLCPLLATGSVDTGLAGWYGIVTVVARTLRWEENDSVMSYCMALWNATVAGLCRALSPSLDTPTVL